MTHPYHVAAVYTAEDHDAITATIVAAITAADTDGHDEIRIVRRHSVDTPHTDHTLTFPRRNLVHGTMDGWQLDGTEYAGWEATIDEAADRAATLLADDEPPPGVTQDEPALIGYGLPLYPGWGLWVNADLIATVVTVTAGNRYAVMAQAAAPDMNGQPVQWALTPPLDSHDEATAAMNDIARQLTTGTGWPTHPTPRKL